MRRVVALLLAVAATGVAACGDDTPPDLGELPPIPTLNDDSSCSAWRQSPRENKQSYVAESHRAISIARAATSST